LRALIRRDGGIQIDDVVAPSLSSPDDVRVRVDVAGLCRTDVYVAHGKLPVREPLIMGHEFAGEVVESAGDNGFRQGERVTAIPLLPCGSCAPCIAGHRCAQPRFLGVDRDGAFADEVVLPAGNLRRVPASLEPRHAAYTEPVAAALAVLNAPLPRDGLGLILGTSRIGLLTERILKNAGFSDVHRIAADEGEPYANQAAFVIETEATEQSLQVMLDSLRPGGLAILKSRPAGRVPLNVAQAVKKDIRLFAVSYAPFDEAVELITSGALGLEDFLGETFPLDQYRQAFAASDDGASVKVFFRI
jgi:threonine dehydrogenase-like Zn-dependent dehydrogenase